MTEVTEAMSVAGQRAEADNAYQPVEVSVRAIYLTMEAARIPAPAPDGIEREAFVGHCRDQLGRAGLSAIPIPAPTGDYHRGFNDGIRGATAARADHTTKGAE